MREITADAHGWRIMAGDTLPFGQVRGGSWVKAERVRYVRDTDPRCPGLIVERNEDLAL